MSKHIKTSENMDTVGELIKGLQAMELEPDTPIQCYCEDSVHLELWQDEESGEKFLEIDTD